MSRKIQLTVMFNRQHDYIAENGTHDLTLTIGSHLGLNCYGFILTDGIYADMNIDGDGEIDSDEYLVITAEVCNAAHRLLIEHKDAFMDAVFGAGFNEKHGITALDIEDYDTTVLMMHREILENKWD